MVSLTYIKGNSVIIVLLYLSQEIKIMEKLLMAVMPQ